MATKAVAAQSPKASKSTDDGATEPATAQSVPERNRNANQKRWLEAYAELGTITQACEIAQVGRTTVFDWLHADVEGFKARHAQAQETFTDGLEREMWSRIADPSGNRGSDILLMFALKSRRPDVYRELTIVVDEKAVDAMSELKKLGSQARKKAVSEQQDKPEVSVQEQADAVVRARVAK